MSTFQLGVIEGFYGRDWDDQDRLELLPWLREKSYQSYLYAPKSEHFLRSQWDQPLPGSCQLRLSGIQRVAEKAGLTWGVGFSPLGAVQCFDVQAKKRMSAKLDQLATLGVDVLAVLFDDMHCATEELASKQCEIVDFIRQHMPQQHIIMCPSYYSYDPVLEKVFGAMPSGYWQQLGEGLSADIDIFWTGNQVCSESLQSDDLVAITQALKRPVTLWDNYPVNDGARASKFLHINSFKNRDWQLVENVRGHFCNPMNQCHLSKVALASLPVLYQRRGDYDANEEFQRLCRLEFGPVLGAQLIANKHELSELGLDALDTEKTNDLLKAYAKIELPAAIEVCDWLSGQYEFDPACLTETGA